MKLSKLFLLCSASLTVLAGCATSDNDLNFTPQQQLFQQAEKYVQNDDYTNAIRYLKAYKNRFPRGKEIQQVDLDLMYVLYASNDRDNFVKAQNAANLYLQRYGRTPNDAYVLYISALAGLGVNKNWTQDLFRIDPANRDSQFMRESARVFQLILKNYPNSVYAKPSEVRFQYLIELLARHEVNIAKFYAKRNAWVAVADRLVQVQRDYPLTQAAINSLPLLKEAYQALHLPEQVAQTEKLIKERQQLKVPVVTAPQEPPFIKPPKVIE